MSNLMGMGQTQYDPMNIGYGSSSMPTDSLQSILDDAKKKKIIEAASAIQNATGVKQKLAPTPIVSSKIPIKLSSESNKGGNTDASGSEEITRDVTKTLGELRTILSSPEFTEERIGNEELKKRLSIAAQLQPDTTTRGLSSFLSGVFDANTDALRANQGSTSKELLDQQIAGAAKSSTNQVALFKHAMDILKNSKTGKEWNKGSDYTGWQRGTKDSVSGDNTKGEDSATASWVKQVQADKDLGGSFKMLHEMETAINMLKNNSSISDQDARLYFIKALTGSARITNAEMATTLGNKALAQQLLQAAENAKTGKWSNLNRGEYINLMSGVMKDAAKSHEARLKTYGAAAEATKVNPERAQKYMDALRGNVNSYTTDAEQYDAESRKLRKLAPKQATSKEITNSIPQDINLDTATPDQVEEYLKTHGGK